MVTDMDTTSQASNSLGANPPQMQGLPAVDNGVPIPQRLDALMDRIGQLERGVNDRFARLNLRLDVRQTRLS